MVVYGTHLVTSSGEVVDCQLNIPHFTLPVSSEKVKLTEDSVNVKS